MDGFIKQHRALSLRPPRADERSARGSAPQLTPGMRRHDSPGVSGVRRGLIAGDLAMIVACFSIPAVLAFGDRDDSTIQSLLEVAAITIVCVATAWYQGLWSSRITSVRMIELSRIPRVFVVGAVAAAVVTTRPLADLWGLVVLGLLSTLAFVVWRSAYRSFVAAATPDWDRPASRPHRRLEPAGLRAPRPVRHAS